MLSYYKPFPTSTLDTDSESTVHKGCLYGSYLDSPQWVHLTGYTPIMDMSFSLAPSPEVPNVRVACSADLQGGHHPEA
jgi:hypothetical protein